MLVVKVEIWPRGNAKNAKQIGLMKIVNDGTSKDPKRGNYIASVFRRGQGVYGTTIRVGMVENFPRKSYHVMRLVLRALKECFTEEK